MVFVTHTVFLTVVSRCCLPVCPQAALFAIDLLFEKSYERKPIFVRHFHYTLMIITEVSTWKLFESVKPVKHVIYVYLQK